MDPLDLSRLSPREQRELLRLLELERRLLSGNRLADYRPYRKQANFHAAGATHRERLFMAGNQLGKTWAGAFEVAMHLTGRYPDWWQGRRFDRANHWLAGSESAELTRKGVQRLLLGRPELREEWGTGAIPRDALQDTSPRAGVPGAVSSIVVRHVSGEDSTLQLLSYDQGRTKWQADTVDGVWFDEEPPPSIYFEGMTRTNAVGGMVMVTFTPLKGMSEVVMRYLIEKPASTSVTQMTIEDAEHYSPEERAAIIASYPEHEREARTRGVPIMGSGRVFPLPEESVKVEPFPIPPHWYRIVGMDFGIDHPTAAVWLAIDRDTDTVYVTDTYRVRGDQAAVHASSIRSRGSWMPVAWPHDGLARSKETGRPLRDVYVAEGLSMLTEHATNDDGSVSLESTTQAMLYAMQTGQLRVFSHLLDWFEEFRLYHRKDGRIVTELDDLMSATRYAWMMRRYAKVAPRARQQSAFVAVGDRSMGY